MTDIDRLRDIMRALRDPKTGCPWDVEQTHKSIAGYVLEEAYEVYDAIETGEDLVGELGDLLLQVVFHAQMAEEAGAFTLDDVIASISDKMVARHPHVFGDAGARDAEEQRVDWERIKAEERGRVRTLDGVARALPALTRAQKLQKRAARVGFDWDNRADVIAKIAEEAEELADAPEDQRLAEFGDLIFAVVNAGRHYGLDPEAALRLTNDKFEHRFAYIEDRLAEEGRSPADASLDEMETHWQAAKTR
ncbi:nucleoside triphosphate pyrophosphohydrolase [Paracoccaceae bacterium GXU_MW_L88]